MEKERNIAVAISNDNEDVTPFETIDAIKKAGFKNVFVQWYNKDWDPSQQQQLDYIKKSGLNVIFAHLGYQKINDLWLDSEIGARMVERYKNDIRICKENGISLVVMHITSKSTAPAYNELGIKRLQEIADYAQKLNVRIALENTKIKGYVEYALQNIKNDNLGFCFDVGHYHAHFNDELDFDFFKNRIFAVHLHDNDQSADQHLLPFDGTLDWEATMKHLKECNYDGPITLELCYRNDYLNMGIENFYKKGVEVAEKLVDLIEEKH